MVHDPSDLGQRSAAGFIIIWYCIILGSSLLQMPDYRDTTQEAADLSIASDLKGRYGIRGSCQAGYYGRHVGLVLIGFRLVVTSIQSTTQTIAKVRMPTTRQRRVDMSLTNVESMEYILPKRLQMPATYLLVRER